MMGARCGFPGSTGYELLQRAGAAGGEGVKGSGWIEPGQVGRKSFLATSRTECLGPQER